MNTLGFSVAVGLLVPALAAAQPGGADLPLGPAMQGGEPQPAPLDSAGAMAQPGVAQPTGPNFDPAANPTRATFASTADQQWDVFVDRVAICSTPCTLGLSGVQFIVLKSQERSPVRLDVGYLPPGDVMVTGKPLREGMYAGGIVATTFAGMALATGITLTAIGYGADVDGMKTAGLITGVAGAVGLYGGIYLMRKALPRVSVGPAQPYVAQNQVGFAGTF